MQNKTDVVFRVFKGELLAIFPHVVATLNGEVMCYAHVGQHGSCDYKMVVKNSRIATSIEYDALKKELISIGYDLNIISKQHYNTYINNWRNADIK